MTSISNTAFYGCTGLTTIEIPNNVTSIGNNAFYGCTSLLSINIPNGVTSIGYSAFENCIGLTSIEIPISVTDIGNYAFRGCTGLTNVTLPDALSELEFFNAFEYCSSITSIIIPDGVKHFSLQGCSKLTDVFIPKSVESINQINYLSNNFQGPLANCNNLSTIVVDSENKNYDSRDNCNAIIETKSNTLIFGSNNTIIPSTVTSIAQYAFSGLSLLGAITIPSSVSNIYTGAFAGCTNLTSIAVDSENKHYDSRDNCNAIIETSTNRLISGCKTTVIPSTVTSLSNSAFYGITGLTSATIPNAVTSIENLAFRDCRLENVVTKSIKTDVSSNSFSAATFQHAMLYIPAGSWQDIVYESGWYRFNNIREMASSSNELSTSRAYTLMDAQTFGYTVYDGVNNELCTKEAYHQVDENNLNNSWQIVNNNNKHYLYNIGARKFANVNENGALTLMDIPSPIEMEDGNKGIIMGSNPLKQWNFVLNQNVEIDKNATTDQVPGNSPIILNNEMQTYCTMDDVDFSNVTGLKAYTATGYDHGTLTVTRVLNAPAGTGLLIIGDIGNYDVPHASTTGYYINLLQGLMEDTWISPTSNGYTNFILGQKSGVTTFYRLSEAGTVAAGKAYLQLPTSVVDDGSNSRVMRIVAEDETTGVRSVELLTNSEGVNSEKLFDLQGRRVAKPSKGIYIVGGQKVVVK